VDEAIHLLYLNKNAKPVDYQNQCPDNLYAIADTQRLLQVFVNLLSNARDASPKASPVIITSEENLQHVFIHVTDRGSGISKQHQEQIFDPFFTTKEAGEGTGLGLSLVYSIIEDLKGYISVESPADPTYGGTRFTIKLPAPATLPEHGN
jgi:signal transduction histidine kinase